MRLSNKHANVQMAQYHDFRGGLNTTDAVEMIAENELAIAENVEVFKGQLKTVAGTDTVIHDEEKTFAYIIYDNINKVLLVTDNEQNVYRLNNGELVSIGILTGNATLEYASWEKGVIIASGGKLQYYNGTNLTTLTNSHDGCYGVFIKSGRVWTYYDDELHCSKVGDEEDWEHDSNDESSAQWLQIGYKDGGKIVGVTSLSRDIIIFKDNHRAYHLAGDYPDWAVLEIGRQIDCKGYNNCVPLADSVLLLGSNAVQVIATTDAYGDMLARNISDKVYKDVQAMGNIKVRLIPLLGQVWFINESYKFMFLDVATGGYFHRCYNSKVMDAVQTDFGIYVLKEHRVCVLNPSHLQDDGENLDWRFQGKTLLSLNQYLIKRVRVDSTPLFTHNAEQWFYVGAVKIAGGMPLSAREVYDNDAYVYDDDSFVNTPDIDPIYGASDEVFIDFSYVYGNENYVFSMDTYRNETRCCDRERAIRVLGYGSGGQMIIHNISFEYVEV